MAKIKISEKLRKNSEKIHLYQHKDFKIYENRLKDYQNCEIFLKNSGSGLLAYEFPENIQQKISENFLLVQISMVQEGRYFIESDHSLTYPHFLFFEKKNSYKELHFEIYKKFRKILITFACKNFLDPNYFLKNKISMKEEYNEIFNEKYFNINFKNSQENLNCFFCKNSGQISKKKCKTCKINLNSEKNFLKFNNETLALEIKISKKYITESLNINEIEKNSNEINNKTSSKISIYNCLKLFTQSEVLDKENEWYCNKCKEHKQVTKKLQIYKAPQILILHLKRIKVSKSEPSLLNFYSGGQDISKVKSLIEFPIENLNINDYVLGNQTEKDKYYDLFAVSNHYGGANSGHYTASAKNYYDKNWYYFDDSSVSKIKNPLEVVSANAYILFYRRKI